MTRAQRQVSEHAVVVVLFAVALGKGILFCIARRWVGAFVGVRFRLAGHAWYLLAGWLGCYISYIYA